jgi:signal transduction histidine kinase
MSLRCWWATKHPPPRDAGICPDDPDQRNNLLVAKRSADHLLFLGNNLLDVVRMERGRLEICLALFSLRERLDHVWSLLVHSPESHGIDFVIT